MKGWVSARLIGITHFRFIKFVKLDELIWNLLVYILHDHVFIKYLSLSPFPSLVTGSVIFSIFQVSNLFYSILWTVSTHLSIINFVHHKLCASVWYIFGKIPLIFYFEHDRICNYFVNITKSTTFADFVIIEISPFDISPDFISH